MVFQGITVQLKTSIPYSISYVQKIKVYYRMIKRMRWKAHLYEKND